MTTDSFKQAAYAQETDQVFIALLTITSDELTEPIYIASDPYQMLPVANVYGVVSQGHEFVFLPFDITLPRDDKTGTVSAKIEIENIDREIVAVVRSIRKPAMMKIQVVMSRDVEEIELEFADFQLRNVSYDAEWIQGDLTLDYWGLEPFPSGRFTPSGFPGLF